MMGYGLCINTPAVRLPDGTVGYEICVRNAEVGVMLPSTRGEINGGKIRWCRICAEEEVRFVPGARIVEDVKGKL